MTRMVFTRRYQYRRQTEVTDWIVFWLAFALALWDGVQSRTSQQQFIAEPENQTVVVGTKVVLPCRVKDKWGNPQWTRNSFGLDLRLSAYERYAFIGQDEEGDISLVINPVTLEDEAEFQCQVMGGENQPNLRSRTARLTVLVPPEPPRIVQGSTLEATEETEISLECVSAGGKPKSQISWLFSESGVLTHGIENSEELLNSSELHTSRSVLKFTPKRLHHKTKFICRTEHVAEKLTRSAVINLEVQYAPRVTVSMVGNKHLGGIMEGSDVRVVCLADANPSFVTYRWFINKGPIMDTTKEIVLKNVGRSFHGTTVLCQTYNALGMSEASETLNITYGPRFRLTPRLVYAADSGSTVTMTCDAEGRPPPDIKWLFTRAGRNKDESLVGTSPNLTVIANSDRKGRYSCKAHVDGFPEIVAETELFLHGKPEIFLIRSQFTHSEVLVECSAISLPKHDRVTWSHNGEELPEHDVDYDVVEYLLPTGIKSVLHIRDTQERTAGIYKCSVTNAYGTDWEAVLLIARSEAYLTFIIVTGVIGAAVVIAVTVGMVLYRRFKTPSAATCKPPVVGDFEGDELCRQTSNLSSNVSVTKINLPTVPLTSRPVSETDSERVVDDLSSAKAVRLPFSHINNHNLYATSCRASTFTPQPVSQQERNNFRGELCRQTSDVSSNVSVTKLSLSPGSLMSGSVSKTDSERVIDDLSSAKAVRLPFTHINNHNLYATSKASTFSPQPISQQDQRNGTYVSYNEFSLDDTSSLQIYDVGLQNDCRSPEDKLRSVDVIDGLPTSRCASLPPLGSSYLPPYGAPRFRFVHESFRMPPPLKCLARSSSTVCSGHPSTTSTMPTQSFLSPSNTLPPCNTAGNESLLPATRLSHTSPVQDALAPHQTSISNQGLLSTII